MVASFVPVPCSQIAPASISWLWEPYLARGKLSVIDGDPGTGKSFVTIDLAARISSGAATALRRSIVPAGFGVALERRGRCPRHDLPATSRREQ